MSKAHHHDDRDVDIALGEFPRIFSGADSLNLHPLSWLPQSLLVCLAGELVKQLVRRQSRRISTGTTTSRSRRRRHPARQGPSRGQEHRGPRRARPRARPRRALCLPSWRRQHGPASPACGARRAPARRSFGTCSMHVLIRLLVCSFHTFVQLCMSVCVGLWAVVPCARVVGPSGPKDVPVTIYMSCMMVWCVWNHSQRARKRGIVDEDQGNL